MELKLSCPDFTFPLLPHDDVLQLIAMLGFQGVDIGLFEDRSHIYPSHVMPDLAGSARDLTSRVHDKGLEIADVYFQASGPGLLDLAINHPDAEDRRRARDLFARVVEFTLRCNATHISIEPGLLWEGESYETSLQRACEELAWRVELAQEAGCVCAVEPNVESVARTPAQTHRLLEMTAGLTLTLDYSHFAYREISDDESETLIPHTSHFHVRGGHKNRLQSKFQDNVIDYARVVRALRDANYTGYICIEYIWTEWEGCNEVDNLSETIQMRDLLRSVDPN